MRVILALLLFPSLGFAAEIFAADFSEISFDAASAVQARQELLKKCDDSYWSSSNVKACRAYADQRAYDSSAVAYCFEKNHEYDALKCLAGAGDRKIPAAVFDLCRDMNSGRAVGSDRGSCLSYFATSVSVIDTDAAKICLKNALGDFLRARSCLNAIRDRRVGGDELRECGSKTGSGLLSESFAECVDRVATRAEVRTDVLCGARKAAASGDDSAGRK